MSADGDIIEFGRLRLHRRDRTLLADGEMNCVGCGSIAVTERPEVTARGYRRFRCRDCGRQCNERSGGVLNRTCLPSDIVAFVVFCRLRYRLTLRDMSEILLLRGIEASHETIRDWRPDDIAAIEAATARRDRLDAHIEASLADWSLAPV